MMLTANPRNGALHPGGFFTARRLGRASMGGQARRLLGFFPKVRWISDFRRGPTRRRLRLHFPGTGSVAKTSTIAKLRRRHASTQVLPSGSSISAGQIGFLLAGPRSRGYRRCASALASAKFYSKANHASISTVSWKAGENSGRRFFRGAGRGQRFWNILIDPAG